MSMSLSVEAGLLVMAGDQGGNGGGIVGGCGSKGRGIPKGGGGGGDGCVALFSCMCLIHSTLGFRTGAGTEDSLGWLPNDPVVIGQAGEDVHAEVLINSLNSLGTDSSRVEGGVGLGIVSGEAPGSSWIGANSAARARISIGVGIIGGACCKREITVLRVFGNGVRMADSGAGVSGLSPLGSSDI
jgi:hypothetical protein